MQHILDAEEIGYSTHNEIASSISVPVLPIENDPPGTKTSVMLSPGRIKLSPKLAVSGINRVDEAFSFNKTLSVSPEY